MRDRENQKTRMQRCLYTAPTRPFGREPTHLPARPFGRGPSLPTFRPRPRRPWPARSFRPEPTDLRHLPFPATYSPPDRPSETLPTRPFGRDPVLPTISSFGQNHNHQLTRPLPTQPFVTEPTDLRMPPHISGTIQPTPTVRPRPRPPEFMAQTPNITCSFKRIHAHPLT